jgi:hypothetical protein
MGHARARLARGYHITMISDKKPQAILPALSQACKAPWSLQYRTVSAVAIRMNRDSPYEKRARGSDILVRQATLATAKLYGCRIHLSCGAVFCTYKQVSSKGVGIGGVAVMHPFHCWARRCQGARDAAQCCRAAFGCYDDNLHGSMSVDVKSLYHEQWK